ncbi:MAG: hypothetical protein O3A00_26805, partial [Planctomycetota bacterium]|nr:hypothetical protein [Planctomycetota bacterium]
MDTVEQKLKLEGSGGDFVIGADFWFEIVEWALQIGWLSEHSIEYYQKESYVAPQDAERLAEALDIMGGNLILQSNKDVAESFISNLADALLKLQRFSESGGFRIIPMEPDPN